MEIKETRNYGMFRLIDGNRTINESKVSKIVESIKEYGYIGGPVIVNERMEVVDGQHRLRACEQIGIKVPYTIVRGAKLNEVMVLNATSSTWNFRDYVDAYAVSGNPSFLRLRMIVDKYWKELGYSICERAVKHNFSRKQIYDGTFQFSEEEYSEAVDICEYLMRFAPVYSKMVGKRYFYCALIWCYRNEQVDNERVYESIISRAADFLSTASVDVAIQQIDRAYNFRRKTDRVDLVHLYKMSAR